MCHVLILYKDNTEEEKDIPNSEITHTIHNEKVKTLMILSDDEDDEE